VVSAGFFLFIHIDVGDPIIKKGTGELDGCGPINQFNHFPIFVHVPSCNQYVDVLLHLL
jgi:hypothetical protein